VNVGAFGRLTDSPASFVVVGARVVDPASLTDGVRDVAVVGGILADVPAADCERIDGRGLVLTPGLYDLHAHLREPGIPGETVASGSRAAAHGGFTTLCAMPNTDPAIDSAEAVTLVLSLGAGASCRVRVIGAASRDRAGHEAADLEAMAAAGAVGFSDDGASVVDPAVALSVLETLARLGLPLIEHAEDAALAGAGIMRRGAYATRLALAPWPPEAELAVVQRDLALAEATGAQVHLTHLSAAAAVDVVRDAKARGVAVTCDVTPHHLALTDAWVAGSRRFAWEEPDPDQERAYDGSCRVNPPLAARDDALALLAGVADGTVDAIATDHAPHPRERKSVPFDTAAPGLIGLETALSLGLAAVEAGRLDLAVLLGALSARPAAIIGETRRLDADSPADFVLFDPAARWRVDASALASESANTPLIGMELPGVVRMTVAGGRVTYRAATR
jgi:dihydroorotase